jgi:hypothetical protein
MTTVEAVHPKPAGKKIREGRRVARGGTARH